MWTLHINSKAHVIPSSEKNKTKNDIIFNITVSELNSHSYKKHLCLVENERHHFFFLIFNNV